MSLPDDQQGWDDLEGELRRHGKIVDCVTCDEPTEYPEGSTAAAAVDLHQAMHRFGATVMLEAAGLLSKLGVTPDRDKVERWRRIAR